MKITYKNKNYYINDRLVEQQKVPQENFEKIAMNYTIVDGYFKEAKELNPNNKQDLIRLHDTGSINNDRISLTSIMEFYC